ncbi:hypothetical protein [Candidatus Vidania fulgoroideorum]
MKKLKKLIFYRKTCFVREGGRKINFFSFSYCCDGGNKIGIESSKNKTLYDSIKNSADKSEKKMFEFYSKNNTFIKPIEIKISKTKLVMIPKKNGGIVAGNKIREILQNTCIKNVIIKIYGSKNKINVIKSLKKLFLKFKIEKNR